MRHAFYPPLAGNDCIHGERKDRTTSTGEPLCPLCRADQRRQPAIDPTAVDYASLAARDDLWDDDPEPRTGTAAAAPDLSGAIILAALFTDDSGHRLTRLMHQWQHQPEQGILF